MDPPLNSNGIEAARTIAKVFKGNPQKISVVLSSPLLRAIQTADCVHDVLKVKIRVISDLREQDLGKWEGKKVTEVPTFSMFNQAPPGGEKYSDFENRIERAVDFILAQKGTPLVVSHGLVGHCILKVLEAPDAKVEKCVLYRFSLSKEHSNWIYERI
jgi:broad specificity phosphatase PhoE